MRAIAEYYDMTIQINFNREFNVPRANDNFSDDKFTHLILIQVSKKKVLKIDKQWSFTARITIQSSNTKKEFWNKNYVAQW